MTRKSNYNVNTHPPQLTPNDLRYPDLEAGKPEINGFDKQQEFQKKSNGFKFWKKNKVSLNLYLMQN